MTKWILFISILFLLGFIIFTPTKLENKLAERLPIELKKYSLELSGAKYAIIIDYDKPVYKKRLWLIDLDTKEVLINSHVSHAYKSGLIWPTIFSNIEGSNISSYGTFQTLNSYESSFGRGEYKVGMRLKGLEKGINNNVLRRNIVFHSSYGMWSSGCFMTMPWINKEIIDYAKDGNLLVVHKSH